MLDIFDFRIQTPYKWRLFEMDAKGIFSTIKIFGTKESVVNLDAKNDIIKKYCTDKDVLHVGCTDSPQTEMSWKQGNFLHFQLEQIAKSIVGIDLDAKSIGFLRQQGINNIVEMNAENITLTQKFDVIVAGDIIEHMNNPGLFLEQVPGLLNREGLLVISVPIAFSFVSVLYAWLAGKERIHKDHCFYFSPKTLATLCSRYDLLPVSLFFVNQKSKLATNKTGGKLGIRLVNLSREILVKLSPFTATQIIMAFKKSSETDTTTYIELQ